jgi:hypothetical protein
MPAGRLGRAALIPRAGGFPMPGSAHRGALPLQHEHRRMGARGTVERPASSLTNKAVRLWDCRAGRKPRGRRKNTTSTNTSHDGKQESATRAVHVCMHAFVPDCGPRKSIHTKGHRVRSKSPTEFQELANLPKQVLGPGRCATTSCQARDRSTGTIIEAFPSPNQPG